MRDLSSKCASNPKARKNPSNQKGIQESLLTLNKLFGAVAQTYYTGGLVCLRRSRVFSRGVTAAMLVSLNKRTAAMLVSPNDLLVITLF